MTTETFREYRSPDIPDSVLTDAARLFSDHYGTWNTPAGCSGGKQGNPVKLSASRLRSQYLPTDARWAYVSVHVDENLAGNAFACRWDYQGRQVCWITQLVVHREYRERRLATRLLEKLREVDDEIFGIMSSHPAACVAASKACADLAFPHISLGLMQACARDVMAGSPIAYVREAKLCGTLFEPGSSEADAGGLVSGVDTNFFVDHTEPLRALSWLREQDTWPLGDLPDGHEFLFIFESLRRRRSRSLSRRPEEVGETSTHNVITQRERGE